MTNNFYRPEWFREQRAKKEADNIQKIIKLKMTT